MKIKLIDIVHRFLPLAWHTFFIIFIAFHMTKDGLNIIVDAKYNFLIYLNIALVLAFFIAETIWAKKIISKYRLSFYLLFLVLAVTIPPLMHDWKLSNTFIVIASGLDLLIIMLKMVKDSFFNEERLANQKLPINQFTDKRKLVSRIIYVISFVLLFTLSFLIFYYNEVSLEALVILTFVGIIIVSIGEILRMSISLKPLNKFIKKFNKDLDFPKFEASVLALDEDKLHDETRNMMNILLWEEASFVSLPISEKYEALTFKPKNPDNLDRYNEALFWFLLNSKKYEIIMTREAIFKKLKNKKKIIPYLNAIKGEDKPPKFKKKPNKIEELKKELYYEIINHNSESGELHMPKIAIMFESDYGNTKKLADAINLDLGDIVVYCGKPDKKIKADLYILGSGILKGDNKISYLSSFKNSNIAIFGTCGYNKGDYLERLFNRAKAHLDDSNRILGYFYSLGEMKASAKDKFVSIIKANKEDSDLDIEPSDFNLNQNHPDDNDLKNAVLWAREMVKNL